MRRPRILAVANRKGGVGKTTTAINLAAALAAAGAKTLLVDLDPQGNASTGLGIAPPRRRLGTYAVISGAATLRDARQSTEQDRLSILPADSALAGAEIELVHEAARERRLQKALDDTSLDDAFVLVDCPPSLGLLTLNALVAASHVLVPLQCEFFALEGVTQLTAAVEQIRQTLNPNLAIAGIVLTMYDRRNNLSELVAEDVRSFFGDRVFSTVIPRNVRLSEAPSHGQPINSYDAKSPGAVAYAKLADEILRQERMA